MKKSYFNPYLIFLFIIPFFFSSCEKTERNKVEILDPESSLIDRPSSPELKWDFKEKILDSDDYISITGTQFDPNIVINIYPPDNYVFPDDVVSITIKSKDSKPWTLKRDYAIPHINNLQYNDNYAIVSYYSADDNKDYVSYYTFENQNMKVSLERVGKILKGTIPALRLYLFNGTQFITISGKFELRPADDGLSD